MKLTVDPNKPTWCRFDATTTADVSGTYSRTGTNVTVTLTNHGLIAGQEVYVDITSGLAIDGTYAVQLVLNANSFIFDTAASGSTSGNLTLKRVALTAGNNVHHVAIRATGQFVVNFAGPLPDANYAMVLTTDKLAATAGVFVAAPEADAAPSNVGFRMAVGLVSSVVNYTLTNRPYNSVVVMR